MYLRLGAYEALGDVQLKAVQRMGFHLANGGKGLVEKRSFGLGKFTDLHSNLLPC